MLFIHLSLVSRHFWQRFFGSLRQIIEILKFKIISQRVNVNPAHNRKGAIIWKWLIVKPNREEMGALG